LDILVDFYQISTGDIESMMNLNDAHQMIAEWLNNNCDVFISNRTNDITTKIDFLDRALELLRYKNKHLENKLEFEIFIQGQVFKNDGNIAYTSPEKYLPVDSGTRPIRLQAKLLMFLLLNHNKSFEVYRIIENFIHEIWDQLTFLDFKKTKTGVTRCFTNTRFAANTLRDYGLLKFTKKEAYKTWTLSLFGFLVAADVLDKNLDWELSSVNKDYRFALNRDILNSCNDLKSYDDFVKKLQSICNPSSFYDIYQTFDYVFKEAFQLLDSYLEIIKDRKLSEKRGRKRVCQEFNSSKSFLE